MRSMPSIQSIRYMVTAIALLALTACSHFPKNAPNEVDLAAIQNAKITNLSIQQDNVFASGQPTQTQMVVLADSGIKHIISLRAPSELEWDEAQKVEATGMQFHRLPITGKADLTASNAESLEQLLADLDGQPVLVHCGSSNRVAALKTLTARKTGASIDASIEQGRQWGLTKMEPVMRTLLESR